MRTRAVAWFTLSMLLTAGGAFAGSIGPDVVLADLYDTRYWGRVGDIVAYSLATEICNPGDEDANWIAGTNEHPVIAQNLYRLNDGAMEQIGMSWLKHGFTAINGNACGLGCIPPGFGGDKLGVGCSDPYDAGLNGDQGGFGFGGLGPRFEVNAFTGVFPYPYTFQGQTGDDIYKRLQVHVDDVTPALNPDALYFIEGQYVTADDAQAGNGTNNASYRPVRVANDLDLILDGPTVPGQGAIFAWQAEDPTVDVVTVQVPDEGQMHLASKVTNLGGGMWHYEYAIHNLNSHRSAQAFEVPVAAGVTVSDVGFHDVDYHSGEPFALTDWTNNVGSSVRWETDTFAVDPNANALRWGTMYNFRFDADAPPTPVTATIDLFRDGSPGSVTALTVGPGEAIAPTLNLTGACPGVIDLQVDDLTANGQAGIVTGTGGGVTTVPTGLCSGTDLDLGDATPLSIVTADGNGSFAASPNVPSGSCGQSIQVIDLTTCLTSDAVPIP